MSTAESRLSLLLASPDLLDTNNFALDDPDELGVTNICRDLELDSRPVLGVLEDMGEGVTPPPWHRRTSRTAASN